ncbi:MAG: hypothetical protein LBP64_04990 [Tannerella sp.]|jgi:ABC-type phosphate transport system substrate-binding protein|nr:hypothetical protein [Tannerella sp.]
MVTEEYRNTVQTIATNGIEPNRETILSRKYPFASEVYAVTCNDLNKNFMAYKLAVTENPVLLSIKKLRLYISRMK